MKLYGRDADRAVFAGITGMGKTCLIRQIVKPCRRLAVMETKRDYSALGPIVYKLPDRLPPAPAPFRLLFSNPERDEEKSDAFARLIRRTGNLTAVFEDYNAFAPSGAISRDHALIWTEGRGRGVGAIASTPRLALMDVTPCAEATAGIYAFRLFHPRDLKYLDNFVGPDAAACSQLPKFHYIHFDGAGNKTPGMVKI